MRFLACLLDPIRELLLQRAELVLRLLRVSPNLGHRLVVLLLVFGQRLAQLILRPRQGVVDSGLEILCCARFDLRGLRRVLGIGLASGLCHPS